MQSQFFFLSAKYLTHFPVQFDQKVTLGFALRRRFDLARDRSDKVLRSDLDAIEIVWIEASTYVDRHQIWSGLIDTVRIVSLGKIESLMQIARFWSRCHICHQNNFTFFWFRYRDLNYISVVRREVAPPSAQRNNCNEESSVVRCISLRAVEFWSNLI